MYSFRMSFWIVPLRASNGTPCFSATARYMARRTAAGALIVIEVETDVERDPVEQHLHVGERIDRHALAPHLPLRQRIVRILPHQGRQIERGRQPSLSVVEQVFESLVGVHPPMPKPAN